MIKILYFILVTVLKAALQYYEVEVGIFVTFVYTVRVSTYLRNMAILASFLYLQSICIVTQIY